MMSSTDSDMKSLSLLITNRNRKMMMMDDSYFCFMLNKSYSMFRKTAQVPSLNVTSSKDTGMKYTWKWVWRTLYYTYLFLSKAFWYFNDLQEVFTGWWKWNWYRWRCRGGVNGRDVVCTGCIRLFARPGEDWIKMTTWRRSSLIFLQPLIPKTMQMEC